MEKPNYSCLQCHMILQKSFEYADLMLIIINAKNSCWFNIFVDTVIFFYFFLFFFQDSLNRNLK